MVKARKDLDLTQAQLGAKVDTSQNMISLIESGEVGSSTFILAICRVLKIAEPLHYVSDEQKTWSQLGHLLRNKHPKKYRRYVALLESEVEDDDETPGEKVTASEPPARK